MGEGQRPARSEDLRHENFGGVDGFDDSGEADFAFAARAARATGSAMRPASSGGVGAGARREEQGRNEQRRVAAQYTS